MKVKTTKFWGTFFGVILAILAYLAIAGISWLLTCAIIKLVTICFGWPFSLAWATGIWLIMYLVRSVFNRITVKKK